MKDTLKELLDLYDSEVKRFLIKHPRFNYRITIHLTLDFLKQARRRIIVGHKKYGTDWKTKKNIKERDWERLDDFNYTILDACQTRYKKLHKK